MNSVAMASTCHMHVLLRSPHARVHVARTPTFHTQSRPGHDICANCTHLELPTGHTRTPVILLHLIDGDEGGGYWRPAWGRGRGILEACMGTGEGDIGGLHGDGSIWRAS